MPKILAIEDEQSLRTLYQQGLSQGQFEVYVSDCWKDAEEKIKNNKFDLILLDIGLPDIDGIEALKKIKDIDKEIAVIMVTAYGTKERVIAAQKIGIVDFVVKPVRIRNLRERVNKILNCSSPTTEVDEFVQLGPYQLLENVGLGGMAEVYKAKQYGPEGFQKIIAIKKILSNLCNYKEFVNMFIEEAKLAAQLNHPNIAQIYDLGKIDNQYFIAMEYICGQSLKMVLEKIKEKDLSIPYEYALLIIYKTCSGLDYAHRMKDFNNKPLNIIHRDLNPYNILISYEGEVKIVDFGIAKAESQRCETRFGVLKGKISYMSPEQASGMEIDQRSDLFSLGIVLYELIFGKKLFVGDSELAVLEKVKTAALPDFNEDKKELPKEICSFLEKLLAKDLQARYQTASELLKDIESYLYTLKPVPSTEDLANFIKNLFDREF